MRNKLILLLVSLYLLGSTEFHQVLKLPLLLEHYAEHRGKVEMTFWEFLVMHYETDVPHDDRDMSLPFKDCHHSQSAQFVAVPHQNITLIDTSSSIKILPLFCHSHLTASYLGEIFQPPRT